jgi:hypothetical protein
MNGVQYLDKEEYPGILIDLISWFGNLRMRPGSIYGVEKTVARVIT